ncbi:GTP cyclohydrolase N terminal-domain-containing protein [Chaetomium strumarium]|uniref:GTP cyclohydrolase N terminal-domain-containing protein n=1 Tax=Chaetomium strumarium TaxID=1170767 RepID=A0AAJ0GYT2_9PEZI|nr:GTP cyclohydrolase N terminal-domain-containing protein [Chaetomium strumarium]
MASSGLEDVKEALKVISQGQTKLMSAVESVMQRVAELEKAEGEAHQRPSSSVADGIKRAETPLAGGFTPSPSTVMPAEAGTQSPPPMAASPDLKSSFSSRVVLTTYPKQIGIKPLPLEWGAADPLQRGPVTVSRSPSTIGRRNAIGAHGGSYSIYYALAVASRELKADHRPDFTNTEPAVNIGPFPQWSDPKKIVAMDPWGHLVPWIYKDIIQKENGMFIMDLRPTIAVTKAHMKLPELEESVKGGRLVPDGKVCLNDQGELNVTKFAVEPVWYLPGVAERFGIDEGTLRRSLFEHTGGMYPELITRSDIKVFLPPIGGLTVYCFGDPANMSDPSKKLALRIHDECNGSDVFCSDICTCRPYLIFGIEEAVKEAQNGGSGVVIYFRKEGRALGEVTKVFVYNARKRGEDRASDYFKRTENIAGVKDMRFQALMPDILHWLGITKIDRMLSMSNMKHDAIVGQGIPIHERVELPESWIPADSRVEIDAKINAGYFTTGHRMTEEELKTVQGRIWEE